MFFLNQFSFSLKTKIVILVSFQVSKYFNIIIKFNLQFKLYHIIYFQFLIKFLHILSKSLNSILKRRYFLIVLKLLKEFKILVHFFTKKIKYIFNF